MGRDVCVVDDDRQVVELVSRFLSANGHRVHSFLNPLEAQEYMKTGRVEIAFIDLFMPELDGETLAAWARERVPFVRLIMMTGQATLFSLLELRKMGCDSCVLKGNVFVPQIKDALRHSIESIELWERSVETVRASSRQTALADGADLVV